MHPRMLLVAEQKKEEQQITETSQLIWAGHQIPAYMRDGKVLSDLERIEIFKRTEDFLEEEF